MKRKKLNPSVIISSSSSNILSLKKPHRSNINSLELTRRDRRIIRENKTERARARENDISFLSFAAERIESKHSHIPRIPTHVVLLKLDVETW